MARLEARGHRVLAPDLPGHGRDHSLIEPPTYCDYVDRIVEILRGEVEPAILVGHSMGGAVITGAAEAAPDRVRKLVYLAAFLAPSGRSMIENAGTVRSTAEGMMKLSADGRTASIDSRALRAAFYADCSDDDVALAQLCLSPQSIEPLLAPVIWTPERGGRIPRTYIACNQDSVKGDAEAQRAVVETVGGTDWIVLEASHSPFFSMPDELADTLERALV
jgi:pimeloyl-ACP methyl ester carboxylesterase